MPTSKAISASSFFGKDRYEYYLNELLTENTVGGQKLSKEQLKEGFSRRKNKISFEKFVDKVVTTKAAKAAVSSPGKGPSPASGGGMKGPRGNALVRSPSSALQKYTGVSQKVGAGIEEDISAIAKYMSSIADTLALQKKVDDDASAYEKRKAEQEKRNLAENKLEKRFEGLKKLAEKIIAPVKSLLDKILQFFTTVILGRIVYRLVEWLGDEKNVSKVKSIIRFVKDWWPALLGSYILFGTSFGKLVRGLTGTVGRFIFQIGKVAIPQLLKVIAKNPLTSLVVGGAAAAGVGAYAASQQNEQKREGVKPGQGTPGSTQLQREQVLQRGLGGMFNGGGFVNGFVSGEKGVDKVPAMLSDGEFVMSRGAVAKYGVDTLEAMNAAGGGTNKPKIMSGTTYAQGGGMIGDIPLASSYGTNPDVDTLRRAARVFRQFGTEEDLFKAFKKLNGVPDFAKMVGGENIYERIFQGHHGADDALDAIRQSAADKIKAVNNPQSFTQSSRAAAGLDDLAKKFDMDAKTAPRYAENLPRLNTPKSNLRGQFTNLKSDYFLRGQFSNLPADYFSKAAKNVRAPIPATSAIVPYTGGGLARTGITGGLSVPQIKTNMKVPGGFGNLKSLGVELLLSYLVQSGLDYVEAKRLASSIEKARKESPEKLRNRIEKLRELVDKEERFQKSFGGILQKVIKLGGETGSEVLSRQAKTILSGLGAKTFQGGKIMGGYGLKDQSFKDAPKTQIMTDDKGRPFVGYKAMRGGKTVYVRGPQPGTGTSNPLESLGRMINPGAYKNIDAANARKKYDEASKGSISSLKARGATQATIAKRQSELNKRKPLSPPTKPKPKVVVAGGGMNGRRGSGSKPSTSNVPNFSASTRGSRSKQNTLGLAR
jgi:hypothetical protein